MKTLPEILRLSRARDADYRRVRHLLSDARTERQNASNRKRNAVSCQAILQNIAQNVQQQAHKQIASVVTRCLRAVFDHPYKFRIAFERKRGKTEARLTFVRGQLELEPLDGCGGGVVDVAAFALRLACLMLRRPKGRRLLVLDEPFRFLSERRDYRNRVRDLLLALAEEMQVQFVLVTHDSALEVGKVVELE